MRDWLREGARVLLFRAPRWQGLIAAPATLLGLTLAAVSLAIGAQWLQAGDSPAFIWQGLAQGWAGAVLTLWLCWVVSRSQSNPAAMATCTAATLWALLAAAALLASLLAWPVVQGVRAQFDDGDGWPLGCQWLLWLLPQIWLGLAQAVLLLR